MIRRKVFLSAAVVLALAALGAPAWAQDPPAEIAELAETCAACHGADGRPVTENTPVIWGQEEYYIYVQMRDFQAGRRDNEIMAGIVADLSRDQMRALGKHFAQLPWPELAYRAKEGDVAVARKMSTAGQCPQCHLSGFEGDSRVPRGAGQAADYLEKTMLDFKFRRRMNAPAKVALMESFSESDIGAMARYMAALQPR